MNKIIKIIALVIVALGFIGFSSSPVFADDICNKAGVSDDIKAASGCPGYAIDTLPSVIQGILNVIIGVSSIIAVIFIIIGGVNYMTSSGDAAKVTKAKNTILYAVIGLVICALAFAIVNFVIIRVLGQK